jgi:hypothetical protein
LFKVKWENRIENAAEGQSCFVSLDGTDFKIHEPTPFSSKWYSHKFNGPALRYEIGLCIRTGIIVWAHGGYPAGQWSDLRIARNLYIYFVEPGELTLADKGYRDPTYFILPNNLNSRTHKKIMARHETVNKRIKQFNVLCQRFRHPLNKHKICFLAVANLTQLALMNGEPLYNVIL